MRSPLSCAPLAESEYRVSNTGKLLNGLKQRQSTFGVINLKAAEGTETATFVQLKLTFMRRGTNQEVVVPRTFMTMYDVDTTLDPVRECQTIKGASRMLLSENTELQVYRTYDEKQLPEAKAVFDLMNPVKGEWSEPLVCATNRGIGADNPSDGNSLTSLQRSRSIMSMIEYKSSFHVRLALSGCCTTGRNYLFGYALWCLHCSCAGCSCLQLYAHAGN